MTTLPHNLRDILSPAVLREELRARRKAEAEQSLLSFLRQAWPWVEPGRPFLRNWHHEAVAEHLEAVTAGQIRNLAINIPPGTTKSRLVTVAWPCWEWGPKNLPHLRYLCASYSQDLATDHNLERRSVIQSAWYQRSWGDRVQLVEGEQQKTQFSNTRRGRMMITSTGGMATGRGGERLIADDPLNPEQAESEADRATARRFFARTFQTRLRDKKAGARVLVMQRVHEEDMTAMAKEWGWDILCLPAEYEPDRSASTVFPGCDPRTEAGQLLWPEHEGPDEIKTIRQMLGSYGYAGQYQQRPAPAGGGIFRRDYFRYYQTDLDGKELVYVLHLSGQKTERILASQCWRYIVADLALSKEETADYTVAQCWLKPHNKPYLILADQIRGRMEAPDVEDMLRGLHRRWKGVFVGVENKHYGTGVIQKFQREGLPVKKIEADRAKEVRARAASIYMENGLVFFPEDAPWLDGMEAELLVFNHGAHDDQVDATSYGILEGTTKGLWTEPPPPAYKPGTYGHLFQLATDPDAERRANKDPFRKGR